MSTKKGYIVQGTNGNWVIAERMDKLEQMGNHFLYKRQWYKNPIPIHPDSLPTILSNGSLKPEYQGEVEYEVVHFGQYDVAMQIPEGPMFPAFSDRKILSGDYAIPKPVESKGDVWEEAEKDAHDYAEKEGNGFYTMREYREHQFNYLKQHYNITKKQ